MLQNSGPKRPGKLVVTKYFLLAKNCSWQKLLVDKQIPMLLLYQINPFLYANNYQQSVDIQQWAKTMNSEFYCKG